MLSIGIAFAGDVVRVGTEEPTPHITSSTMLAKTSGKEIGTSSRAFNLRVVVNDWDSIIPNLYPAI